MKSILILLITTASCSCNLQSSSTQHRVRSEKEILECYYQYLDSIKFSPVYENVMISFADSLESWIEAGLEPKGNLKNDEYQIADEVFFNTTFSNCLLLISAVSKDSTDKYDMVKICAGELVNNKWRFYYRSYPVEYFFRDENKNKPYKKEEIIRNTTYNLCLDGFIDKKMCKINGEYVSSEIWFQDWMREKHKEFWNSAHK